MPNLFELAVTLPNFENSGACDPDLLLSGYAIFMRELQGHAPEFPNLRYLLIGGATEFQSTLLLFRNNLKSNIKMNNLIDLETQGECTCVCVFVLIHVLMRLWPMGQRESCSVCCD